MNADPVLTPEILIAAYRYGIFPMAENRDDPRVFWVDPEERGILPLDDFHIPRRLAQTIRNSDISIRIDTCFTEIIELCAAPSNNRPDSWINTIIAEQYVELYKVGHAHSIECWLNDEVVGGLYGVSIGGAFFGESMFSRVRDASKIALVYLVARLKFGGYQLLDTQFLTEHLAQFGARSMEKEAYKYFLSGVVDLPADFNRLPETTPVQDVLHFSTQTS